MPKTALITGILGQDGSYLSELLVSQGYRVVGTTHREATKVTVQNQRLPVLQMTLNDTTSVEQVLRQVEPDEIYHLASRSSSTQLFDDPWATTEINALATLRLMEAMRKHLPKARLCQAGSSEVFAGTTQSPQNEDTAMSPVNAYGAAKAYARHLVKVYREQFGIKACTAIVFNHESPRRGQQYVTRKISRGAAAVALGLQQTLSLGSLESERDWGHARDTVRGMWLMLQEEEPQDLILATGVSHRIRDFCELAFAHVGLDYTKHVQVHTDPSRRVERISLRGDATRAKNVIAWQPQISFKNLVHEMVDADLTALRQESMFK
jgi:GDPmannose 4,6-dehydratase